MYQDLISGPLNRPDFSSSPDSKAPPSVSNRGIVGVGGGMAGGEKKNLFTKPTNQPTKVSGVGGDHKPSPGI